MGLLRINSLEEWKSAEGSGGPIARRTPPNSKTIHPSIPIHKSSFHRVKLASHRHYYARGLSFGRQTKIYVRAAARGAAPNLIVRIALGFLKSSFSHYTREKSHCASLFSCRRVSKKERRKKKNTLESCFWRKQLRGVGTTISVMFRVLIN